MKPGDRIGIIGANGSGKSSLLNMLAGKLSPDSGEIEVGQTVKVAYYTQENEEMNLDRRMIEYIKDCRSYSYDRWKSNWCISNVRTFLIPDAFTWYTAW